MSAQHTPGPWVPDYLSHLGWAVRTSDENGPADFIVESVTSPGAEAEANARLIAAAPELATALAEMPCIICETAVGADPVPLNIPGITECPGCKAARAVLAKARGAK